MTARAYMADGYGLRELNIKTMDEFMPESAPRRGPATLQDHAAALPDLVPLAIKDVLLGAIHDTRFATSMTHDKTQVHYHGPEITLSLFFHARKGVNPCDMQELMNITIGARMFVDGVIGKCWCDSWALRDVRGPHLKHAIWDFAASMIQIDSVLRFVPARAEPSAVADEPVGFPKPQALPVAITVDRFTLGDAVRKAYLARGNDSWCTIADDVINELQADPKPASVSSFLVALATGGTMEQPDFEYSDYDVIEASDENEARRTYNKKWNCSYFYGMVIRRVGVDGLSDVELDLVRRSAASLDRRRPKS